MKKARTMSLPTGAAIGKGGLSDQLAPRTSIPKGLAFGEVGNYDGAERTISGTSIFDPVLCELAYRWFCPPGGLVLDPFAGGSVRGIVAGKLGRRYRGIDLREEQIAANREQHAQIVPDADVLWLAGDSRHILDPAFPYFGSDFEGADFIFTCPPYADLEVYSDLPEDISNMPYPKFREAYSDIIAKACARLKPDRFACVVIGDARGKDGSYYGLPWHTVEAFQAAGLKLYNEAVLVTAAGSLPVRARKGFEATRKLGKTHQNILIFVKGSQERATKAIGKVEFGDFDPLVSDEAAPPPPPLAAGGDPLEGLGRVL
jgi:DNA modification methylase